MKESARFETSSLLPRDDFYEAEFDHSPNRKRNGYACIAAFSVFLLLVGYRIAPSGAVISEPTQLSVDVEMEGKKHQPTCEDGGYSKRTLKMAFELPFQSLFKDTKGQKKFEASDVVIKDGFAYAVCDSSWSISKFGDDLLPFGSDNLQLGDPKREAEDSGYEALFHDNGSFYVVRESIQHDDDSFHAVIEQLDLSDSDYEVVEECSAEFEFEGDSKGFEGVVAVHDLTGNLTVIGLCEGNHCSESRKKDKGNGQLVVMQKGVDSAGTCQWETIREINIPSSAFFEDYSAITLNENGKVGITSQEESQLWVGSLLGQNDAGLWDIENMEFDPEAGKLYDFPKNDDCKTVYCNIEGVHWISEDTIMAVSDKMKSRGKQDFRCFEKDQSVHVFVLP